MTRYRHHIRQLLAAVDVVSATAHGWFGVRSNGLSDAAAEVMGAQSARAYLVYNLQAELYANFYCAGRPRARLDLAAPEPPLGTSPFVQALSAANAGTHAREPGWTVLGEEGGTVVVARGGLSLWVPRAEVYTANGAGLSAGAAVGVLMPKELLRLSPGFYMALGATEFPLDGSASLVRLYWNLRSEGAVPFVALLTQRLNHEGLAFRLKVVSDPARYSRCDAGVLYIRKDQYEPVARVLAEVHPILAPTLKPMTPALTKQLAPGLGLAEDPGGGLTSFGMNRCQLLAEGIVRAAEDGAHDPDGRLASVAAVFAAAGVDLEAPYLNPGSRDDYHLPVR